MKNGRLRRLLLPLIVLGVLALGGVVGYFYYQGANYVSTDNASVDGNVVYVYPPVTGILASWDARLSQPVTAGTVLGTVRSGGQGGAGDGPQAAAVQFGVPITAPIDGVIVKTDGVVGQQVAPSAGVPLAAVVDTRDLWVTANVAEGDVHRVHVGEPVDVTVDAVPGRVFQGTVEAVQQAAESVFSLLPSSNTSGTFTKVTQYVPVKVRLASTVGLAPGLNAEVRIHVRNG